MKLTLNLKMPERRYYGKTTKILILDIIEVVVFELPIIVLISYLVSWMYPELARSLPTVALVLFLSYAAYCVRWYRTFANERRVFLQIDAILSIRTHGMPESRKGYCLFHAAFFFLMAAFMVSMEPFWRMNDVPAQIMPTRYFGILVWMICLAAAGRYLIIHFAMAANPKLVKSLHREKVEEIYGPRETKPDR